MTNRRLLLLFAVLLTFDAACGDEEHAAEGEPGVAAADDEANDAAAAILPLETFLTNINDPAGEKHARVQVKLAITPEAAAADIQADALLMARLHDRVLTLLTTKTYQQLTAPEGKEAFRGEIREQLNPLLTKAKVREVLFSDFVVE